MKINQKKLIFSLVLGIVVTSILGFSSFSWLINTRTQSRLRYRAIVQTELDKKASDFERGINSRIAYNYALANMLEQEEIFPLQQFSKFANSVVKKDTVIRSISLVKDFIITNTFPLKSNEQVPGIDVRAHNGETILKTQSKSQIAVSEPQILVEGGKGIIIYCPMKKKGKTITDFVVVVLDYPKLFQEIKYNTPKFRYALGKFEFGQTIPRHLSGVPKVYKEKPVMSSVNVPGDRWTLFCMPINGWNSHDDTSTPALVVFMDLLFGCVITAIIYVAGTRNRERKELAAILNMISDHVLRTDFNGIITHVYKTNGVLRLLKEAKREDYVGKSLLDYVDKKQLAMLSEAIKKCHETEQMQEIEIEFTTAEQGIICYWARLYYMNVAEILLVARDYTLKKQWEKELIKANQDKDKFFSIISHDLKNPILSQENVLKVLYFEFDDLSNDEKREFVNATYKSSVQTSRLVLELLDWARSQTGRIVFEPKITNLTELVQDAVNTVNNSAEAKNIFLNTEYFHKSEIKIDYYMISTVVRNLISNAIKFTYKGGKIEIVTSEDADYINISVKDNGIGMKQGCIQKLFQINNRVMNYGTNCESGSGLGLILCKEFVEMHHGIIIVKSEEGKGSEFIVSLPKK